MTGQPVFTPVRSSNIAALAHHDGALHVKFNSGAHWKYPDVPATVHEALMSAPSAGKALNAHVIGKYWGQKVG